MPSALCSAAQRSFGGVLVALAALGFAGVQRPKGPKP